MKILHVITGLQKAAGTSVFCGEVCNQLAALGHDVTIAILNPSQPNLYPLDPRIHLVSIESILAEPLTPQTFKLSNFQTFSLIHIHALWSPILHKVACWAHARSIPVVWSTHGMITPWAMKNKRLKKWLGWHLYQKRDLQSAALLHATAQSEVEDIRRMGLKNKVVVAPLGVHVKEVRGERCAVRGELNAETQRRRAEEKVEEWVAGVDEATFAAALEKLVAEKTAAGEYRFKKEEERGLAIEGAKRFFAEFSRKIVPLSDGRCVYFAPDARSKARNGSNAVSWAEYAFHAVSNGGVKLTGKDYHERWYNPHKIPAFASIVSALTTEHCFVRLSGAVKQDAIVFAGAGCAGESVQVVTRLDETGNMDANLSEVTFTSTCKGQKKLPRLVPLTEAVRTVVHHQTTAGSYPPNNGIITNSSGEGKGVELSNLGHAQAEDSTPFVDNKIAYYFARVNGENSTVNLQPQPSSTFSSRSTRLNRTRTLLFVSRVQRKKGLPMLLEAWAKLKEKGKRKEEKDLTADWKIRIVGPDEGGHVAELMAQCDRLGLPYATPEEGRRSEVRGQTKEDNVHSSTSTSHFDSSRPEVEFVGPKFGPELDSEYASADLFVLPTHSENFGSVVIESLAQGVPVICTKGAPWEELETYHCGRWIDIGVEPLVAALSELLNLSTSELSRLGENGRKLVAEKYTWPAVAQSLQSAYEVERRK